MADDDGSTPPLNPAISNKEARKRGIKPLQEQQIKTNETIEVLRRENADLKKQSLEHKARIETLKKQRETTDRLLLELQEKLNNGPQQAPPATLANDSLYNQFCSLRGRLNDLQESLDSRVELLETEKRSNARLLRKGIAEARGATMADDTRITKLEQTIYHGSGGVWMGGVGLEDRVVQLDRRVAQHGERFESTEQSIAFDSFSNQQDLKITNERLTELKTGTERNIQAQRDDLSSQTDETRKFVDDSVAAIKSELQSYIQWATNNHTLLSTLDTRIANVKTWTTNRIADTTDWVSRNFATRQGLDEEVEGVRAWAWNTF